MHKILCKHFWYICFCLSQQCVRGAAAKGLLKHFSFLSTLLEYFWMIMGNTVKILKKRFFVGFVTRHLFCVFALLRFSQWKRSFLALFMENWIRMKQLIKSAQFTMIQIFGKTIGYRKEFANNSTGKISQLMSLNLSNQFLLAHNGSSLLTLFTYLAYNMVF